MQQAQRNNASLVDRFGNGWNRFLKNEVWLEQTVRIKLNWQLGMLIWPYTANSRLFAFLSCLLAVAVNVFIKKGKRKQRKSDLQNETALVACLLTACRCANFRLPLLFRLI